MSDDDGLSEADTRVGLHYALRQGLAGSVMGTLAGGIFLTKVALSFGASLFAIGLLAALPAIAQLSQLPATYLVERYRNRKRIAFLSLGGVRLCILAIALVPLFASAGAGLGILLALILLQGVFGAMGGSAWNSWLRDLVPEDRRGSFFSRRQSLSLLIGVPLSVGAAWFVDYWAKSHPANELDGYAALFVAGALAGVVGLYFLLRTPEPRMPAPEGSVRIGALVAEPFRDGNFRRLIHFLGAWNLAVALSAPFFTVYLLTRLGYGMPTVIGLSVLSQLSNAAFAPIWGRLSDSFSNKAVLDVSGPLVLVGTGLWLFTAMPDPYALTLPLLVVIHVLLGVSMSGVSLATGNIGMKLAPRGRATAYLASTSLVGSLAGGLGPVLGGAIAGRLAERRLTLEFTWQTPDGVFSVPAFTVSGVDFAFVVALFVGVYSMGRLAGVVEEGRVGRPEVVHQLFAEVKQPFLSFSTAAGVGRLVSFPFTARAVGREPGESED